MCFGKIRVFDTNRGDAQQYLQLKVLITLYFLKKKKKEKKLIKQKEYFCTRIIIANERNICNLIGPEEHNSGHFVLSVSIKCALSRRILYLTGGMTSLYSFIQGSLEWSFSELFFSDACCGIDTNLLLSKFYRVNL